MVSHRSRGWLPWVLLVIGMVVMLIVGLISPWRLSPAGQESPETVALLDFVREQYIISVGDSYAANGDLARAQERLGELEEEDTALAVAELAARYVDSGEEVETTRRLIALAQALGAGDEGMAEYLVATAPSPTPTETLVPTSTPTESPTATGTSTPIPTATNTPRPAAPPTETPTTAPAHPPPAPREWDPRLDFFWPTVRMEEAQVGRGEWYWRLIRTRWEEACGGRLHIYIEVLGEGGDRSFGETIVIEFGGSPHYETYPMPDKLGEEYAYNYMMTDLLGSYNVYIDGPASDKIYGLGLGTRQDPYRRHHTCFFLTFQRTYQP